MRTASNNNVPSFDGPAVFHPNTTHPGVQHARHLVDAAHEQRRAKIENLEFVFVGDDLVCLNCDEQEAA